jgi:hypothetical protein
MRLAGAGQFTLVRRKTELTWIDGFDSARDRIGGFASRTPCCKAHRAVLRGCRTSSGGDRLKDPELIRYGINTSGKLRSIPCPEISRSKKLDALQQRRRAPWRGNGGVHRVGIAGVKTGCNIRRTDHLKQLIIVSGAFAEIGIDVDS